MENNIPVPPTSPQSQDKPPKKKKWLVVVVILGILVVLGAGFLIYQRFFWKGGPLSRLPLPVKPEGVAKFESAEEFKLYLQEASSLAEATSFGTGLPDVMLKEEMPIPTAPGLGEGEGEGAAPERISETNVQVAGIDEPDIVKTDGKEIYFSRESTYPIMQRGDLMIEESSIPPYQEPSTQIIKAFPPESLAREAEIDKYGNLLLTKDILVIFAGQDIYPVRDRRSYGVYGYNVADPAKPEKKWTMELDDNTSLVQARLYQDKIYLVTKNQIDENTPCPIKPLTVEGEILTLECTEIYHPTEIVPVDTTFVALKVDASSGKVEEKTSFIGSSGSSVVYMSPESIYITYSYYESVVGFLYDFYKTTAIVPDWFLAKLEKLKDYEISERAKLVEFETIYESYLNSLGSDERLRVENEVANKMSEYYETHKRDLEKSGIVKIEVAGLRVKADGVVPGYPLNQFALDEYEDYLRIAVTVGEGAGFLSGMGRGASINDVYVLDKDLEVKGQVQDLGKTERIYSVRFIEDKGYLVTFRQTDPFYVLDLSDPNNPKLAGELKIPGYSGYLHPITGDKILGIGEENWQVKISLFDVSDPEAPQELAKYLLDEYHTDILSTHHAFLMDKKHNVFFLPGGRGGYIFSYLEDKLTLIKAVSETGIERALYLDDFMYILGSNKITVLNETNWETVKELELE